MVKIKPTNISADGSRLKDSTITDIQGINDINNNLNSVVAGIGVLATGMFNMSGQLSSISGQIADIKSSIDVNNAIAAVNAYQNYQTKRALNS